MPVRIALCLLACACWDAWRLLAGRIEDGASVVTVLILLVGLVWRLRQLRPQASVPAPLIAGLLMLYALASWTGPALLQIGAAIIAVAVTVSADARPTARLPAAGAALLLLPILPTLDFLLAYPLRRISVLITATLLRMNGMAVGVEGVALDWHGQRLLFDGPCSGVKMLWAALLLANLVALVQGASFWRYVCLLGIATVAAVAGNALRAASLFYLENGFVERLRGPVAHEAVGIVAFLMLAAAILLASRRMDRRIA